MIRGFQARAKDLVAKYKERYVCAITIHEVYLLSLAKEGREAAGKALNHSRLVPHYRGNRGDRCDGGADKAQANDEVRPSIIKGSTVAFECRVVDKVEDRRSYIVHRRRGGDPPSPLRNLYSIHYRKLVSIDAKANVNSRLEYD